MVFAIKMTFLKTPIFIDRCLFGGYSHSPILLGVHW